MRSDYNQQGFFELLRAGLWDKEAKLSQYDSLDYSTIMMMAEEQSVVGIVTSGMEKVVDVKVPKEFVLPFVGSTLQIERRNKSMNEFVAQLIKMLRNEDIYTLLVKGQGVARCYDRPLWRTCGDIDILLNEDQYKKTKILLVPLASSVETENKNKKHLGIIIDTWVVELHGRLCCGLSSRIDRELDRVYQDTFFKEAVRSWDNNGVQVFLLKAENEVFYVFTHILQHYYKEGVGLKQVCDWCRLLWYYRESLDQQLLEKRIRRSGLITPWRTFGAFAVEYLGMPEEVMLFYSPDACWKRKAKRINGFILRVGNMGHNRDLKYHTKYPYFVKKCISMGRRLGDLIEHAFVFPLDSIRFFSQILLNGLVSAARGE